MVIKVRRWPCYLIYIPVTYRCLSYHPKPCIKPLPFYLLQPCVRNSETRQWGWCVCSIMSGFSDGRTRMAGCDLTRGSWNKLGGESTFRMTPLLMWYLAWDDLKAWLPWGSWLEDLTHMSSPQSWGFHRMAVSGDWVLQTHRELTGFYWAGLGSLSLTFATFCWLQASHSLRPS